MAGIMTTPLPDGNRPYWAGRGGYRTGRGRRVVSRLPSGARVRL